MKYGGRVSKPEAKKPDLGPVDAVSGPRVTSDVEKKCLAKYRGPVKNPGTDLRSKSMVCRGAALNYLWRQGGVTNLVAALRSDSAQMQKAAFERLRLVMSNKPTRKQVRVLIKELSHHRFNNLVRARIIAALTFHSKAKTDRRIRTKLVSALKEILNPRNEELHESKILALKSLGRLHAKEALPEILQTLLKDESSHVRITAINTCIKINPRNSDEVVRALIDAGNATKHSVADLIDDTAATAAEKTIKDVSKMALSLYFPTEGDVDLFVHWAKHKATDRLKTNFDIQLHASIVRALGYFQASNKDAMGLIKHALNSPIWHLRKAAAHTLTRIDHRDAPALLKQAIKSERTKSNYGYIILITERVGVLGQAYKKAMDKVDHADWLTVAHYERKFKGKNSSKADRLVWIDDLKEIGSKRALMLLVRVSRNEKELAEVRKVAREIIDDKMPRHVFIPEKPEVEKRKAYSGPHYGAIPGPGNIG